MRWPVSLSRVRRWVDRPFSVQIRQLWYRPVNYGTDLSTVVQLRQVWRMAGGHRALARELQELLLDLGPVVHLVQLVRVEGDPQPASTRRGGRVRGKRRCGDGRLELGALDPRLQP